MIEEFCFHHDAGHAWLRVPITLLRELKIRDSISEYSYRRVGSAYLEEDCDAPRFIEAMKAVGREVKVVDVNDGNTSAIRSYRRF